MAKIAPIPPIQPSRGQVGGGKKKWTNGQNNVVPFPKNGQNQTPFHIDPILLVEKRIEKIKLTGYKNHLEKLKKLHGENNIAPFSRREVENQAEISTIPEVVSTVPEIKSENISAKNEAVVEPKTQTPKKDVLEKKQENLIKVEQKLETQREDKTKPETLSKIEPIQQKTQEQTPAPKIPSKESLINKQEISKIPEKLATTPFNNSQKIENKDNKKDSFPQNLPKKEKLPDNFQTTQAVQSIPKNNISKFQRVKEIDNDEEISPRFKPSNRLPVIQKVDEPKTTTYGLVNNDLKDKKGEQVETGNFLNGLAGLGNHDIKTTTQQSQIPQQPNLTGSTKTSNLGLTIGDNNPKSTTQNSQKQGLEKSAQVINPGNNLPSISQKSEVTIQTSKKN